MLPVSLEDVQQASERIRCSRALYESPLVEAPYLAGILGFSRLFIKNETVHPIGAFKERGVVNHFLQLTDKQKRRGVFAISSGNHAQAVARQARKFGIAATILMPTDAPRLKLKNTRAYGAKIITYDRQNQNGEALALKIAEERGLYLIHPYNGLRTIAGQGTIGLEIHQQMQEQGVTPDALIVPCSGGGLAAGIALSRGLYADPPALYTAEPENFDDMRRSLEAGYAIANKAGAKSACDALMAPCPGENALPILSHHKAQGLTAKEELIFAAMYIASRHIDHLGIKLEPSGATALACALNHTQKLQGQKVVIIASGSNADSDRYIAMLEKGYDVTRTLYPCLAP